MRERALASHINLTFTKGINEVLVDDCSGDDARFFLKFFFNGNKKKHYYQNEKLNLIYTLNILIQKR